LTFTLLSSCAKTLLIHFYIGIRTLRQEFSWSPGPSCCKQNG